MFLLFSLIVSNNSRGSILALDLHTPFHNYWKLLVFLCSKPLTIILWPMIWDYVAVWLYSIILFPKASHTLSYPLCRWYVEWEDIIFLYYLIFPFMFCLVLEIAICLIYLCFTLPSLPNLTLVSPYHAFYIPHKCPEWPYSLNNVSRYFVLILFQLRIPLHSYFVL